MSEHEIETHNARELWRDVENHLRIARESIEQAQSALEDLHKPHIADNMDAAIQAVERFRTLAEGYAT